MELPGRHKILWLYVVTLHAHCHRAAVRLAALPPSHPLSRVTQRCSSRYPRSHRSPIHHLMHIFGMRPRSIEKIRPLTRAPWDEFTVKTTIAGREEAIHMDGKNEAHIRIYADGSGFEGGGRSGLYSRFLDYGLHPFRAMGMPQDYRQSSERWRCREPRRTRGDRYRGPNRDRGTCSTRACHVGKDVNITRRSREH